MTVADLIEALRRFDPTLRVVAPSTRHADLAEIQCVFVDVVAPSHVGYQLADYDDDAIETVVRLVETGEHDDRCERPKPRTN